MKFKAESPFTSVGDIIYGFTVEKVEEIEDIHGRAYVLRHDKTGARIMIAHNPDPDKAFGIAFKTPPKDDTGVFHILEHSVLCGSKKFNTKEPFVNLLKTSMQTYLNALTFPDKTLYPVSSTNDQDLLNLADVYMDAVLNPRIYDNPEIFQQEGWHYEILQDVDGNNRLVYNGVVYNEMKGATSDPRDVLYHEIDKCLLPDTCYTFESGGDPDAITSLTYEEYLNEHRRHYQLSNAYILMYGNIDAEKMLEWLDETYLGCSPKPDPSFTPRQITFQSPVKSGIVYKEMATAPENACCAYASVLGKYNDITRISAASVLAKALFGSNESPMKKALLAEGFSNDLDANINDDLYQPYFAVEANGTCPGAAETLQSALVEHTTEILKESIDKDLLRAAISQIDFCFKEKEYGFSNGIRLFFDVLSTWLYDDDEATTTLYVRRVIDELESLINTDYYDELLREIFLNNPHCCAVEIVPINNASDEQERRSLDQIASCMDEDDWNSIATAADTLHRHQEEPDAPEAIATLPQLHIDDIDDAIEDPEYDVFDCEYSGADKIIRHYANTNGISYMYRYFGLDVLEYDELCYASLLAGILGEMGTENKTAAEIDLLIQSKLGIFTTYVDAYTNQSNGKTLAGMRVGGAVLDENIELLSELSKEIMISTKIDAEKLKSLLLQDKVWYEDHFMRSGNHSAQMRSAAHISKTGMAIDKMSCIEYYRFIKTLLKDYDDNAQAIIDKLYDVAGRIFTDNNCSYFSFTGSDETFSYCIENLSLGRDSECEHKLVIPEPEPVNEMFIIPGKVAYVGMSGQYGECPESMDIYNGAWQTVKSAIRLEYLWNEVRVKGGAYGAQFNISANGDYVFSSYRDPHIDESIKRFEETVNWLDRCELTDDEREGYIISSVATIDNPRKIRSIILEQDINTITNRTKDIRKKRRDEVLKATQQDFYDVGKALKQGFDNKSVCVFSCREIAEGTAGDFIVVDLFNE